MPNRTRLTLASGLVLLSIGACKKPHHAAPPLFAGEVKAANAAAANTQDPKNPKDPKDPASKDPNEPQPDIVTIAKRRFGVRTAKMTEGEASFFTLQIIGDDMTVALGCPMQFAGTGEYNITDDTLRVCGDVYTVKFTATPGTIVVNGHSVQLDKYGYYTVAPDGQFDVQK